MMMDSSGCIVPLPWAERENVQASSSILGTVSNDAMISATGSSSGYTIYETLTLSHRKGKVASVVQDLDPGTTTATAPTITGSSILPTTKDSHSELTHWLIEKLKIPFSLASRYATSMNHSTYGIENLQKLKAMNTHYQEAMMLVLAEVIDDEDDLERLLEVLNEEEQCQATVPLSATAIHSTDESLVSIASSPLLPMDEHIEDAAKRQPLSRQPSSEQRESELEIEESIVHTSSDDVVIVQPIHPLQPTISVSADQEYLQRLLLILTRLQPMHRDSSSSNDNQSDDIAFLYSLFPVTETATAITIQATNNLVAETIVRSGLIRMLPLYLTRCQQAKCHAINKMEMILAIVNWLHRLFISLQSDHSAILLLTLGIRDFVQNDGITVLLVILEQLMIEPIDISTDVNPYRNYSGLKVTLYIDCLHLLAFLCFQCLTPTVTTTINEGTTKHMNDCDMIVWKDLNMKEMISSSVSSTAISSAKAAMNAISVPLTSGSTVTTSTSFIAILLSVYQTFFTHPTTMITLSNISNVILSDESIQQHLTLTNAIIQILSLLMLDIGHVAIFRQFHGANMIAVILIRLNQCLQSLIPQKESSTEPNHKEIVVQMSRNTDLHQINDILDLIRLILFFMLTVKKYKGLYRDLLNQRMLQSTLHIIHEYVNNNLTKAMSEEGAGSSCEHQTPWKLDQGKLQAVKDDLDHVFVAYYSDDNTVASDTGMEGKSVGNKSSGKSIQRKATPSKPAETKIIPSSFVTRPIITVHEPTVYAEMDAPPPLMADLDENILTGMVPTSESSDSQFNPFHDLVKSVLFDEK